jgi:hypothetical protein
MEHESFICVITVWHYLYCVVWDSSDYSSSKNPLLFYWSMGQKKLKTLDNATHRIRVEDEEAVRSLPARNSRWNSLIGGRRAGFSGCSLLDLTGSLYSWIRSWGLHVIKHYESIIFSVAPNIAAMPCNMFTLGGHFYCVLCIECLKWLHNGEIMSVCHHQLTSSYLLGTCTVEAVSFNKLWIIWSDCLVLGGLMKCKEKASLYL